MPDTDRYADVYLSFRDSQAWLSNLFESMTFAEFRGFGDYCFRELDVAFEAGNSAEFRRVKGLLLALARKELEIAHFMEGLTANHRASLIQKATADYELAKSFHPESSVPGIEAAWEKLVDYVRDFGYASVMFEVLTPHPPLFSLESSIDDAKKFDVLGP